MTAESKVQTDCPDCQRFERALKAIAASTLIGPDFGDWVQCVCEDVLDGGEAQCPECGTAVHEGPCVSDLDEDEDLDEDQDLDEDRA